MIDLNADGNIKTSTRIDNEMRSTVSEVRIQAGEQLLDLWRPGWRHTEIQPQNPKK